MSFGHTNNIILSEKILQIADVRDQTSAIDHGLIKTRDAWSIEIYECQYLIIT